MLLVKLRFALEFLQALPRADVLLPLKLKIDVLIVPPRPRGASHESPGLGHMHGFGHQRNEVPKGILRGSRLRHFMIWLRFHRMHEIRKFERILDKEHRHIVADQIIKRNVNSWPDSTW